MNYFNNLDISTAKLKRSDIIVNAIKRMIVEQKLKPGDRLPSEKELIEKFQNSRGTTREALKSLEILGLVERIPGPKGGTRVRAVDSHEAMQSLANFMHFQNVTVVDLYSVRVLLEPMLVERAVGHFSEQHLHELEKMIAVSQQYLEGKRSRIQCRKAELDFHDIIANACPNVFLSFLCAFLNYILFNFLHIESMESSLGRKFAQQNLDYHIKILDALRTENREKARALMAAHMEDAFQYIISLKAVVGNSLIKMQDM
jgi:DNA-binding FadR family transcriptional regulator